MVETWRWPNASYSVLSIWLARDAQPAGGRAVDHQIGLQPLLLLIGIDVAQHRVVLQRRLQLRRPLVELRGACRLAACTDRPHCSAGRRRGCPAPAAGTACAPGTTRQLRGADRAITASMLPRCAERLQRDEHRSRCWSAAGTAAALAGKADHAAPPRDRAARSPSSASSFCCIAWNDVLWSACMPPISRPVSCCGKKPFGMIDEQPRRSGRS